MTSRKHLIIITLNNGNERGLYSIIRSILYNNVSIAKYYM